MLACAAAALVYRSALDNPFVFDDRVTVLLNPSLVDPRDIRAVLAHNLARPVVNASYAFDRWLWGFSSFGFHVTNLVCTSWWSACSRLVHSRAADWSDRSAGVEPLTLV